MNKVINRSARIALGAGVLAAAVSGCCMFGSKKCCDGCGRDPCACCCNDAGCSDRGHDGRSGVNTSLSVGVGTDGVRMGSDTNVGSHRMSVGAGGGMR